MATGCLRVLRSRHTAFAVLTPLAESRAGATCPSCGCRGACPAAAALACLMSSGLGAERNNIARSKHVVLVQNGSGLAAPQRAPMRRWRRDGMRGCAPTCSSRRPKLHRTALSFALLSPNAPPNCTHALETNSKQNVQTRSVGATVAPLRGRATGKQEHAAPTSSTTAPAAAPD